MKKLIMAAAIVCAAAFAQAATYNWNAAGSCIYSVNACAPDWDYVAADTTVYFAFVNAYSQSDLVDDFAADNIQFSKFTAGAQTVVNADGGISQTSNFTADYTTDQQVYFAIIEDGKLFISDVTTAEYNKLSTSPIAFDAQDDFSDQDVTPMQDAADGFGTAGWYSAIPEPTSGLMLLLGMGVLALRRRRA